MEICYDPNFVLTVSLLKTDDQKQFLDIGNAESNHDKQNHAK